MTHLLTQSSVSGHYVALPLGYWNNASGVDAQCVREGESSAYAGGEKQPVPRQMVTTQHAHLWTQEP